MHPLSGRRIAAIATTALVAGGGPTSTVQAADTPSDAPARLLGGIVGALPGDLVGALPSLLDNVLTQTTAELQATLATLTPAEVGDLLADADATQLDALLAGLTSGALSDALATLAPADLTEIVGGLTPAQIGELVAAGASGSLIDGLLGTATALAGGSPGAPAVDGLLAQVGALLGGGTNARPPAAATPAAPRFTAYRATIRSVKLTKKRTSASFELRCPAIAPKGCLVQVGAEVAGRRAARPQLLALVKGTSAPVTVKLTRSAARRLRAKGGSLRLSAQTALSSLPTVTKTVKVKHPRKRR